MNGPSEHFHRSAYIDLLKRSITNFLYLGGDAEFDSFRCVNHYDLDRGCWNIDPLARPTTLLRKGQLDLIERAIVTVQKHQVPGDFIEAGIWRGGAIILMRALLDAYGMKDRKIFAADSFEGIPVNKRSADDPVDQWADRWAASLDEVQANIARFGLLDDKIEFVVGFFEDSLTQLSEERFAVIRLDSDSYESVETSLVHLYPLLSKTGVTIIDDWHLPGCRAAVLDYRAKHGINDPIMEYDANAYWVKQQEYGVPAGNAP